MAGKVGGVVLEFLQEVSKDTCPEVYRICRREIRNSAGRLTRKQCGEILRVARWKYARKRTRRASRSLSAIGFNS